MSDVNRTSYRDKDLHFTVIVYSGVYMAKRQSANTNMRTSRSKKTTKRLDIKREMLAQKAVKAMKGRSKMTPSKKAE